MPDFSKKRQKLSHDKIIFHMLFRAFQNTSRTNLRTHCAKADVNLFKNADLMILSGLKASDMYSPDSSVHEVERIIISTLKNNENVMFPVFPSGM